MKQTFFLGNRCLGSREIPPVWQPSIDSHAYPAKFRHTNTAYCCPTCGEIWGRVFYSETTERKMVKIDNWQFEIRHCPKHPDHELSLAGWTDWKRGSLMHPFPEQKHPLRFERDWPEDAVRWEFNLLMDKLEKEQQCLV